MALKPKSIHFHDYRVADRQQVQAFKKELEDLIDQDFTVRINVRAFKGRDLFSYNTSSSDFNVYTPGNVNGYYQPNIVPSSSPNEDFTVCSRIRKNGNCNKELKKTDSSVLDYQFFRDPTAV